MIRDERPGHTARAPGDGRIFSAVERREGPFTMPQVYICTRCAEKIDEDKQDWVIVSMDTAGSSGLETHAHADCEVKRLKSRSDEGSAVGPLQQSRNPRLRTPPCPPNRLNSVHGANVMSIERCADGERPRVGGRNAIVLTRELGAPGVTKTVPRRVEPDPEGERRRCARRLRGGCTGARDGGVGDEDRTQEARNE
jgi:hypothetical protein